MKNYRYILEYNSANELMSATFDEVVSDTSSVTLTRDALLNTRMTVFASSYSDAVDQANKALGKPTPSNLPSGGKSKGFIETQIEARRFCDNILVDYALLSDTSPVSVPIGLIRFLVDALDIAGQEAKGA